MKIVGTSGIGLEIDTTGAAKIALATKANAGLFLGSSRDGLPMVVSEFDFARKTTTPSFHEPFDSTSTGASGINNNLWSYANLDFAFAFKKGFIEFNSTAGKLASSYSVFTSNDYWEVLYGQRLICQVAAKVGNLPETNSTCEFGFGSASTTSAPTDGAFFRWSGTTFQGVASYGGTETTSTFTTPTTDFTHLYEVVLTRAKVEFWIDGVLQGSIAAGTGIAGTTSSKRQQFFARLYDGGSAPALAANLKVSEIAVFRTGADNSKTLGLLQATMMKSWYQHPSDNGDGVWTQLPTHTNSTNPTSDSINNTSPRSPQMGGRWQITAPASAVTDSCEMGFPLNFTPNHGLMVTGIRITAMNLGAAVTTTATIIDWAVAVNSDGAGLNNADGTNTWAPRRIPIGITAFPATSAIGTAA